MRILSLGQNLIRHEYLDIFNELEKFSDLQITPVYFEKTSSLLKNKLILTQKKDFLSKFFKKTNTSFEKNQLTRILYDISPEVIELHAEPHHRLCKDVFDCCDQISLKPSFILYPENDLDSFLIPPYRTLRKKTLKRISFIVIRNDYLKRSMKDNGFQNSYRKISFPAYNIERNKTDDIFDILLVCNTDLFDDYKEKLLSILDYSSKVRFNIIENKKAFRTLKDAGFNTRFFDFLSREETISILSKIDLTLYLSKSPLTSPSLLPFCFFNKIPCVFSGKTKSFISSPLRIEDVDEYLFKKIILYTKKTTIEYTDRAFEKAEKEYSSGKCAFETYELYKFLFKTRNKH